MTKIGASGWTLSSPAVQFPLPFLSRLIGFLYIFFLVVSASRLENMIKQRVFVLASLKCKFVYMQVVRKRIALRLICNIQKVRGRCIELIEVTQSSKRDDCLVKRLRTMRMLRGVPYTRHLHRSGGTAVFVLQIRWYIVVVLCNDFAVGRNTNTMLPHIRGKYSKTKTQFQSI